MHADSYPHLPTSLNEIRLKGKIIKLSSLQMEKRRFFSPLQKWHFLPQKCSGRSPSTLAQRAPTVSDARGCFCKRREVSRAIESMATGQIKMTHFSGAKVLSLDEKQACIKCDSVPDINSPQLCCSFAKVACPYCIFSGSYFFFVTNFKQLAPFPSHPTMTT